MHDAACRTQAVTASPVAVPAHAAAERLHRLVVAIHSLMGDPSPRAVRCRLVGAARDVTEARYAALCVVGPDGTPEEFLHVGADQTEVRATDWLPAGSALVEALVSDPRPVRLRHLEDDPRRAGLLPGHPLMTSLLSVPVRVRTATVGVLVLSDRRSGEEFTDEDEELALALAASAGVALDHARLHEESETRREWMRASAEVDQALLVQDVDELEVLRRTAGSIQQLTRADLVVVELPTTTADELEVVVASGDGAALLTGLRCRRTGSLAGRAMDRGRAVRAEAGHRTDDQLAVVAPLLELIAAPLTGRAGPRGAVVAGRVLPSPFSDAEIDTAGTLARRAAVALELAEARAARKRLDVLEKRNRMAHNLRDEIVQRLFSAGLSMQVLEMALPPGDLRTRAGVAIDDVDATIDLVQTTIKALGDRVRSDSSATPELGGAGLPGVGPSPKTPDEADQAPRR